MFRLSFEERFFYFNGTRIWAGRKAGASDGTALGDFLCRRELLVKPAKEGDTKWQRRFYLHPSR